MFPFRLRWQAATPPTSKGIGLEITYVAHGRIKQRGESMPAPQGEDTPASLIMSIPLPVERGQPRPLGCHLPAVREPETGPCVSVIRHKLQVLPARDLAVCDLERRQVHLVARGFIGKAKIKRIAGIQPIPNLNQAPFKAIPAKLGERMTILFRNGGRLIRRTQGI